MANRRAFLSILKAHLSRYVDAVKSGEEVIATERGRPVARLSGLDPGAHPDGRTAQLVREGRMKAPAGPGAGGRVPESARSSPPADPQGRSLAFLLEQRADGR